MSVTLSTMLSLSCGLRLVLATILVLSAPSADDRALQAAVRHLRRAVVPRRDGSHLLLLASLRQMRDPTLRSFFYELSQQGNSLLRIHAILGLAEIDESGHIDPWLISQLDSPQARYAAIVNALQLNLIETAQMEELLGWDDLEAQPRAELLARLVAEGKAVDRAALKRLADNPSLDIAGTAAVTLVELGDSSVFDAYRGRVGAAPRAEQTRHLREMFAAAESYGFTSALDWIAETVNDPQTAPEVKTQGIATVLALDPQRGVVLWEAALGSQPSYATCVRYGLLLLEAGPSVPAEAYDRLPRGDPLIERMAAAGRAVSSGENVAAALNALIDLGHTNTTRWAMTVVEEIDGDQAKLVYEHLIDRVEGDPQRRDERAQLAHIAAAKLFEIDQDAVIERLNAAEDDSLTQQAILMGLLESKSEAAGEAARGIKRIGFGRADSLALILVAKHTKEPTVEELYQLGVIASGGGRVSEFLQAQAAWLYLKHTGKIEQALAATFADATSTGPG